MHTTFLMLLLFAFLSASAQHNSKTVGTGHVYGKIIDSKTKEIVPFSSVAIFKKDSLVTGNLAGSNGEFSFEHLPFGTFNLKITSIGFTLYQQVITINDQNEEQDLGDIKIQTEEILLKEVEVVEEKSTVEMGIDRKVFNVDKNITSKGGTAADVMKNIPSVTMDENGNAQLRQNNVTIYVDGRPTTLTLDQIPADQIEKVEVISNPSAKFEANATGGIINIVMKNNTKPGYRGAITGGIGTNNHYNGMLSFSIKQKPIGFSANYNYNSFKNPITAYNYRTNLYNGSITGYYNSDNHKVFLNTFNTGSFAFDYYINNRNTLSLSENITIGDFDTKENQLFEISSENNFPINTGNRIANSGIHFENYTTKAHFKKTFPKKGKEFTSDINYNRLHGVNQSNFTTNVYSSAGILLPDNPLLQNNKGDNQSRMYTAQADYINPINDSTKLEWGLRWNYKPSNQTYDAAYYSHASGSDSIDPYLTNHYLIKDLVSAAYINYTMRYKKINYMLGVRLEDSYYKGTLLNKNDSSFQYTYPSSLANVINALFPSVFISKRLNDKQEVQFNVSRKINRPDFRQLIPFIFSSDSKNYTIGNPQLTPEFITMAEANFNQYLTKGNLFITLFYRHTQNPLTGYNYKSPTDSSIIVSTTVNGSQSNTIGLDNTFKHTLIKGLEATVNLDLFYTSVNASYNNTDFSNQGFYYNTKLNLTYRLPENFSLQLSGNYESPKIIPQGKAIHVFFADCGISKEVYKYMTLAVSVSDIFDTKGKGTYLITDEYTQDYWSRRETRYVKFTASLRFGKADATKLKKRQPTQQQSDQDGGFF